MASQPTGPAGEPTEQERVGERLRILIERLGITQEKFADTTGGHLSRVDINRAVNGSTLARTEKWHDGIAAGAGVGTKDARAYIRGEIDIDEIMRRRDARLLAPEPEEPAGTPEPVSDYVRKCITDWEVSGKTLKDLADASGLGAGTIGLIKKRERDVNNKSGPMFAKAWGLTYDELVVRAYGTSDVDAVGVRAEGLRDAAALNTVSSMAIRRVLLGRTGPKFDHLTKVDWRDLFLEEARIEKRLAEGAMADKRTEKSTTIPPLPDGVTPLVQRRPGVDKRTEQSEISAKSRKKTQDMATAERDAAAKKAAEQAAHEEAEKKSPIQPKKKGTK